MAMRSELQAGGGRSVMFYGMSGPRPATVQSPRGSVRLVAPPVPQREPLPSAPSMPHRAELWVNTGPALPHERIANAEAARAAAETPVFAHQTARYVVEPQSAGSLPDTIAALQRQVSEQAAQIAKLQAALGIEPAKPAAAPPAATASGPTNEQVMHAIAHQIQKDTVNGWRPPSGGWRHPTVR